MAQTKSIAAQIEDEQYDLDSYNRRIAKWEARFDAADLGTHESHESERMLMRLQRDRMDTKINIKRLERDARTAARETAK